MTTPDATLSPKSQKRRSELIAAARDLFLEHGYKNTSLDMVIEQVGGSKREIYRHFQNKEGLFSAAIKQRQAQLFKEIERHFDSEKNPRDVIEEVSILTAKKILSADVNANIRTVISEAAIFPDLAKAAYENGHNRAYALFARYLEQLNAKGRYTIENPALSARVLLSMIKGDLHARALFLPDTHISDDEIRLHMKKVTEIFMDGAVKEKGS
ncbi:TetR/AcrR family transcriptional regulator [Flexibacterium corallicola]|uniref:TetR/AcrR family transcriptional regulator n=1 Tax=Flexibacterium corallicola TaxID=3037259 RepID=UPI00286EE797|nr:TetR/AcrR family transcriptional regulator [Pseudovibrio sp. M1P-2-3]